LPISSDECALFGEHPDEAFGEETNLLVLSAGAALVEVRPAEPRPVIIPGHRCRSVILLAGDSDGRAFSHWSLMLSALLLRGLLFLSAAAPDRS